MCCIFTFCGWMLDLIQRCWIFFMSCCICTAVCCVLITASTSGIALGYNYSLAEYIDLKETNVSVYIKRGVFDDEIADDMEWRRSGHRPEISGLLSDNNVRTGPPANEGETTLKSGRRLDDSIYESSNQNQYEGSLLRLTAKQPLQKPGEIPFHPSPPYLPETTTVHPPTAFTNANLLFDLVSNYPAGSLDHLKAIQTVLNARRAGHRKDPLLPPQPAAARRNEEPQSTYKYDDQYRHLENYPGFPGSGGSARRSQMENSEKAIPSSIYRDAVPRGLPISWQRPSDQEEYIHLTMPPPPTIKPTVIRPQVFTESRRQFVVSEPQAPTRGPPGQTRRTVKPGQDLNEDLDKYKQHLLINQYDAPNVKPEDFNVKKTVDVEEYDEEFKGAPVRKKRSIEKRFGEQSNDIVLAPHHNITNESLPKSNLTTSIFDGEGNINKNETNNVNTVEQHRPSLKAKRKIYGAKNKKSQKNSKKRINRPKRNKHKKRRQTRLTKDIMKISNGRKKVKARIIYLTNLPKSQASHNVTAVETKNIGNTTDEDKSELVNKTASFGELMKDFKSEKNITKNENITHPLEALNLKNLLNFLFW